jgi:hypothetical protein
MGTKLLRYPNRSVRRPQDFIGAYFGSSNFVSTDIVLDKIAFHGKNRLAAHVGVESVSSM